MKTLERALRSVDGVVVVAAEPLAGRTTLGVGGPAELLVTVHREAALGVVRRLAAEGGMGFHLLGLGSNLLVPDEGLRGMTVVLAGELAAVRVRGTRVRAGAGVPLAQLARRMCSRGLVGLEALGGFPSTVGGAVFMNAGAYGTEIADLLVSASAVDAAGRRRRLSPDWLDAGYRRTRLQGTDLVVTAATLELRRGDAGAALERMAGLNRRRHASMPRQPNAGSIFRNPPGDHAGRLLEAAGLKGERVGGAEVSRHHANVVVNTGGARAADVIELMLRMRERVRERCGVELEPEVVLSGGLDGEWRERTRAEAPAC